MAGIQAALRRMDVENAADWMEWRMRQVGERGRAAEDAAYRAYAAATRLGQSLEAKTPEQVMTLGVEMLRGERAPKSRLLQGTQRNGDLATPFRNQTRTVATRLATVAQAPSPNLSGTRPVAGPQPQRPIDQLPSFHPKRVAEVRRQQAQLDKVVDAESLKNSWLAIPALAPTALIAAGEGAALLAVRAAAAELKRIPLRFIEREPFRRGGDNYAARLGRKVHAELKARVEQKLNWDPNPEFTGQSGARLRPDAGTPRGRYLELKPNTPSGRRAAESQVRKYREDGKKKTRAIYYNPKDYR